MVRFKQLNIGDKFRFQDMTWVKVTPVKKRCCTILYNAHVDGNLDIKKTFQDNTEVETIG